jgi:hypothetical protein
MSMHESKYVVDQLGEDISDLHFALVVGVKHSSYFFLFPRQAVP